MESGKTENVTLLQQWRLTDADKILKQETDNFTFRTESNCSKEMVRFRRLKPAKVDFVLMFSAREFQVLQELLGTLRKTCK